MRSVICGSVRRAASAGIGAECGPGQRSMDAKANISFDLGKPAVARFLTAFDLF